MTRHPIYLLDKSSAQVAALDVRPREPNSGDTIAFDAAPPRLRQLFERYEEIEMFGLRDETEGQVEAAVPRVAFDNGAVADVTDLQPFRAAGPSPSRRANPRPRVK